MELVKGIEVLKKSHETGIQLDFFRNNGQVLLQSFKQINVISWKLDIINIESEGLIIVIDFHKDKDNNTENYKRFIDSDLFVLFKKLDFFKRNSFYTEVSGSLSCKEIENFIHKIIFNIYNIDFNNVKFTLKAY
jgi:hypothetical protein